MLVSHQFNKQRSGGKSKCTTDDLSRKKRQPTDQDREESKMAKLEFRKCTECENPDPHGYFFFGEDVFLLPFSSVEFARLIVFDPLLANNLVTSSEIAEMEAQMVNAGLPIKMKEGELANMELICDMTFGADFEDMKFVLLYKVREANQPSCG